MDAWYDHLRVVVGEGRDATFDQFLGALPNRHKFLSQFKDVTIRTKEGEVMNFEVRLHNRRFINFWADFVDGSWQIRDLDQLVVAHGGMH